MTFDRSMILLQVIIQGSSEKSVGEFQACCGDLVPLGEQFGHVGENERPFDERPGAPVDGPSSLVAPTETLGSGEMNRP